MVEVAVVVASVVVLVAAAFVAEAAPVVVSVPTVGGELQQNLAALAGLRLITRAARSH